MAKKEVKFKVLDLADSRSDGSELEVGNVYTGELEESKPGSPVHYRDQPGDAWIFYVCDSCEIVE